MFGKIKRQIMDMHLAASWIFRQSCLSTQDWHGWHKTKHTISFCWKTDRI